MKLYRAFMDKLKWLAFGLLTLPVSGLAATEEVFEVLQVGPTTYRNVTVTTKGADYIFIQHSSGMNNVKVADLSADIRDQLGYKKSKKVSGSGQRISTWAQSTMGRVDLSQLKQLEQRMRGQLTNGSGTFAWNKDQLLALLPAAAIALLCYLFFCYCAKLVCDKTGNEPGLLIWIPVLQLFPLLRAAGMGAGWFVVFLIPVINLIGFLVWALNITQARGKSGWVALFLILPPTNPFAMLYLALSSGTPPPIGRKIEIMALETA